MSPIFQFFNALFGFFKANTFKFRHFYFDEVEAIETHNFRYQHEVAIPVNNVFFPSKFKI